MNSFQPKLSYFVDIKPEIEIQTHIQTHIQEPRNIKDKDFCDIIQQLTAVNCCLHYRRAKGSWIHLRNKNTKKDKPEVLKREEAFILKSKCENLCKM